MPDHSFGEEAFPNIESKTPLAQLEGISSCYLREEMTPTLVQYPSGL